MLCFGARQQHCDRLQLDPNARELVVASFKMTTQDGVGRLESLHLLVRMKSTAITAILRLEECYWNSCVGFAVNSLQGKIIGRCICIRLRSV